MELGVDFTRFFSDRWLWTVVSNFTQNQGLDLDLRSSYGGGLGRHVIQNNRSLLTVQGGAVFTRERFTGSDLGLSNIEGMGGIEFELFNFDDPEMDITTTLTVFPSLSNWGRIRADLDTSIRYELFTSLPRVQSRARLARAKLKPTST